MNIQDRGSIKWASLMLPEHVALLKEVFKTEASKPVLDSQKQAEIDQKLKYSLKYHSELKISYFENKMVQTIQSTLVKVDQLRGRLILAGMHGEAIRLETILDVEII